MSIQLKPTSEEFITAIQYFDNLTGEMNTSVEDCDLYINILKSFYFIHKDPSARSPQEIQNTLGGVQKLYDNIRAELKGKRSFHMQNKKMIVIISNYLTSFLPSKEETSAEDKETSAEDEETPSI